MEHTKRLKGDDRIAGLFRKANQRGYDFEAKQGKDRRHGIYPVDKELLQSGTKYTKKYIKEELTRIYALTGVTPRKR